MKLICVTSEELLATSIEDLLAQPEDSFQTAVEFVLKKNAELYRRLAWGGPCLLPRCWRFTDAS